jgi:hypothetical protein
MNQWKFNRFGFLEVDVSKEILDKAESRNQLFLKKYGNSGTHRTNKSRQRITGYLAEAAVQTIFPKLEISNNEKFDFTLQNVTFDVKAQGCNVEPQPDYVGTLYEEQAVRSPDFYVFARTRNDLNKVWIIGFISKKNFFNKSKLIPSGTKNNNFSYDQSRYEIQYNQLTVPKKLKN